MVRRTAWCGAAVLAAAWMFVGASGAAEEKVVVRAWDHESVGRIVLDWPEPVAFDARLDGSRLLARFDRPFAADFTSVYRWLDNYVAGVTLLADRRTAVFALRQGFTLAAHTHAGSSVVLDLLRDGDTGPSIPSTTSDRRIGSDPSDRMRSADKTDAAGLPVVRVRLGRHPTYTRVVFDWEQPVGYRVERTGRDLSVVFDARARMDLTAFERQRAPRFAAPVAELTESGARFALALPSDVGIRNFTVGNKVVIDISTAAETAGTEVPAASQGDSRRQQAASPQETAEADRAPIAEPPPKPAPATPVAAEQLDREDKKKAADPAANATDKPVEQAAAPVQQETESAPAAEDGSVSFVFDWPEEVAAAVFSRTPYVWIVFDRRAQIDVGSLRAQGKPWVEEIEQLPVSNGTVLRLRPKKGMNPHVQRTEKNWTVAFGPSSIDPEIPIPVEVRADAVEGARLVFPVSELGQILEIRDPGVGDVLQVATLRAPGHGIGEPRRYAEFEILPSAQGVAIDPLSDKLEMRRADKRGVVVRTPGGLQLSSTSISSETGGASLGPRVFDLDKWRRGGAASYFPARRSAYNTIVEVPAEQRDEARLALARFYFANGFGAEALGPLGAIERAESPLAAQPEFHALRGAANLLMARHAEARKDLLDPRLDRFLEVALWRGSMFMHTGEVERASAQFVTGDPILHAYPEPLRTRLALQRIEAALATLDVANATAWIDTLGKIRDSMPWRDAARLQYLEGVLARDLRDLDRAAELWSRVKRSGDDWNAARAEYALVDLGLHQESLTAEDAIPRLERLRFQWRGDALELATLRKLGELYLDREEYERGLSMLRTVATYFPDDPQTEQVAKLMTDTFKNLYLSGRADQMTPVRALALYDEFRELTPTGPEGDAMIQKLAERLIAIDLLDRAADLLAHQVRYRLRGEERARAGAQLAVVYLLDRNAKGALEALRNSFQPNLPQDLDDERRRIRAKAILELGQYDEAIALLAGDVSREADLLRVDIHWRTKNYAEAAKVLQRLSGDPDLEGAYGRTQAQYILSWAVALRLKRDEAGLRLLRDLYGPGMARGPLGDAFAFIASPSSAVPDTIEGIAVRVAEADKFEAFLKNYRERLVGAATAAEGRSLPTQPQSSQRPLGATIPARETPPAPRPDIPAPPRPSG